MELKRGPCKVMENKLFFCKESCKNLTKMKMISKNQNDQFLENLEKLMWKHMNFNISKEFEPCMKIIVVANKPTLCKDKETTFYVLSYN